MREYLPQKYNCLNFQDKIIELLDIRLKLRYSLYRQDGICYSVLSSLLKLSEYG